MSENAGVVLILGDDSANHIDIADTGGSAAGNIAVACDGQLFHNTGKITGIRLRARGGNDIITYTLSKGLTTGQIRNLQIDTGEGHDNVRVTLSGNLTSTSRLRLRVGGGTRDSRIKVIESGSIASNASVLMNLSAGGDANKIAVTNTATISSGGSLVTNLSAGGNFNFLQVRQTNQVVGRMTVNASVSGLYERIVDSLTLASGSTGLVTANVQGGPGNDNLRFVVRKQVVFDSAGLDVSLNGGAGLDSCFRTSRVVAQNCEFDHVVR